jgi:CHAT domain-containing protein
MELSQPRPVRVAQLQAEVMRPGEVLLTYYLLPNETLAFVLTSSTLHLVRLPLARADVARLVALLRAPEDNADQGIASLSQLQPAQLYDAYQKLVAPVEPFFEGAHRILVVADGPLLTLPLEMLVTRWSPLDQRRFDEARRDATLPLAEYATPSYLGERYEFAYLPSLSTFVSMRLYAKPSVQYQTELVSFADPLFESASDGLQTGSAGGLPQRNLKMRDGKLSIPRLPETAEEARGIAEILGGQSHLYLRADAQEHTVKTLDLRSVRFLHFATHGLLGGEFSLVHTDSAGAQEQSAQTTPLPAARAEPALLLSLAGDMQGEDGLLTAHEVVQALNLNAQLVILSACNTAGEHDAAHSGEGVAGLTRAFAFAGARGLVVSHWTVESEATEDTMLALFRDLKAGMGPTESLSKARTAIRSSSVRVSGEPWSRSHPFFWAPFIYVGD